MCDHSWFMKILSLKEIEFRGVPLCQCWLPSESFFPCQNLNLQPVPWLAGTELLFYNIVNNTFYFSHTSFKVGGAYTWVIWWLVGWCVCACVLELWITFSCRFTFPLFTVLSVFWVHLWNVSESTRYHLSLPARQSHYLSRYVFKKITIQKFSTTHYTWNYYATYEASHHIVCLSVHLGRPASARDTEVPWNADVYFESGLTVYMGFSILNWKSLFKCTSIKKESSAQW